MCFELLSRDSAETISGGGIEEGFRENISPNRSGGYVGGLDGQHFLAVVVVPDS